MRDDTEWYNHEQEKMNRRYERVNEDEETNEDKRSRGWLKMMILRRSNMQRLHNNKEDDDDDKEHRLGDYRLEDDDTRSEDDDTRSDD